MHHISIFLENLSHHKGVVVAATPTPTEMWGSEAAERHYMDTLVELADMESSPLSATQSCDYCPKALLVISFTS